MPRRPWELWEREVIRNVPRGELAAVARSLGRTLESVRSARHRFGLSDPRPPWSTGEREAFAALVRNGSSVELAALAIGRRAEAGYKRRSADRRAGEDVPAAVRADGRGYRGSVKYQDR